MKRLARLLFTAVSQWLIDRAYKTPYYHLKGYMERYWLIPYNRFFVAARIHHILASDDDRAFHDHPWAYVTIILRGGYYEITPTWDKSGVYTGAKRVWYGTGSVLFRRAASWHRLEVLQGEKTVTLFITFKKTRAWGFLPIPDYKIPYRDYLDESKFLKESDEIPQENQDAK